MCGRRLSVAGLFFHVLGAIALFEALNLHVDFFTVVLHVLVFITILTLDLVVEVVFITILKLDFVVKVVLFLSSTKHRLRKVLTSLLSPLVKLVTYIHEPTGRIFALELKFTS